MLLRRPFAIATAAAVAAAGGSVRTRVSATGMAGAGAPRVSRDASQTVTIAPAEGTPHTATVIGPIHGLGDTNMGWADAAMHIHSQLPHVKFVLPNAPVVPVTLNGGMAMPSWYDITSLDDRTVQPCAGIEESRATVTALIEAEVAAGLAHDRIVVGGFSQGGAVSLFTGLQYPHALGGVLCMSGYLAAQEKFELSPAAAATPVAHFHGSDDPTVRIEWARRSAEHLRAAGVKEYALKEYESLGHSASMEEIADVVAWLQTRLPPP